jgi:hypothetical protein
MQKKQNKVVNIAIVMGVALGLLIAGFIFLKPGEVQQKTVTIDGVKLTASYTAYHPIIANFKKHMHFATQDGKKYEADLAIVKDDNNFINVFKSGQDVVVQDTSSTQYRVNAVTGDFSTTEGDAEAIKNDFVGKYLVKEGKLTFIPVTQGTMARIKAGETSTSTGS